MATLLPFAQLAKLWKITAASTFVLMSGGGIVTLIQCQNASGVATCKLFSDGSFTGSGDVLIDSGNKPLKFDAAAGRLGIGHEDAGDASGGRRNRIRP